MTDDPATRIESLNSPPEGWFWSPEARDRRRSNLGVGEKPVGGQPLYAGARSDAESTADLPTLRPGIDTLPTTCTHCGGALLNAEPPLGEHARGLLSCETCGRQLCWLVAAAPPRHPEPQPERRAIAGRFERLVGCGPACGALYGHDAVTHDEHGRRLALAIAPAVRHGIARFGALAVDFDRMTASVGGVRLRLTPIEFRILAALAEQPGLVYQRYPLVVAIWGAIYADENPWHILRVNMSRLRGKLGAARHLLVTVPEIGYRLEREPGDEVPHARTEDARPRVRPTGLRRRLVVLAVLAERSRLARARASRMRSLVCALALLRRLRDDDAAASGARPLRDLRSPLAAGHEALAARPALEERPS